MHKGGPGPLPDVWQAARAGPVRHMSTFARILSLDDLAKTDTGMADKGFKKWSNFSGSKICAKSSVLRERETGGRTSAPNIKVSQQADTYTRHDTRHTHHNVTQHTSTDTTQHPSSP